MPARYGGLGIHVLLYRTVQYKVYTQRRISRKRIRCLVGAWGFFQVPTLPGWGGLCCGQKLRGSDAATPKEVQQEDAVTSWQVDKIQ